MLIPRITLAAALAASCSVPPASAPLTRNALANGVYRSTYVESGEVKLSNGRADVRDSEQTVTVVLTDHAAFGDLDGDGRSDAAAVLVTSTGGTGSFYDLVAVVDRGGAPVHVASTRLGDRVQVESLGVDGRRVKLAMTTHAKEDPLCCPTLQVTRSYELQGSRLVEAAGER
jgi:hypothetical protein